jgi:cytochrome b561
MLQQQVRAVTERQLDSTKHYNNYLLAGTLLLHIFHLFLLLLLLLVPTLALLLAAKCTSDSQCKTGQCCCNSECVPSQNDTGQHKHQSDPLLAGKFWLANTSASLSPVPAAAAAYH